MSDRELRALERAAASGDADAEARLLVARLRAGDLPEPWLEAAARLGHEPARRALGRWVPFLVKERLFELRLQLGVGLRERLRVELWRVTSSRDLSPAAVEALTRAGEPPPPPGRRLFPPQQWEGVSVHLTDAEWRGVRQVAIAYALGPPPDPPPAWPAVDAREAPGYRPVVEPRPTRTYFVRERYAEGDVLSHPKFGVGTVTRATKDKVDVAFPDGARTLAHGRGP